MVQGMLLTETVLNQQSICFDNVNAVFTKISDATYEVVLEINSHKFLLRASRVFGQILEFEIIAVKGFMEISRKIVEILKNFVDHLFYRLD